VLPRFAEAFFDDNSSDVNFNDFISELQVLQAGLKNRPIFSKFSKNRWNRAGLNFKTAKFIVHCFKISKKR
jgi:hypothetical protein